MRNAVALLTLVSLLMGCQPAADDPMADADRTEAVVEATPIKQCDWPSTLAADEPPEAGASPPCDIEFREILRLEGDLNGVIPSDPLAILADGSFLTATYEQGRLALWSADGRLSRVTGNGAGEGPGEFQSTTGFVQIEDGELLVLTGDRLAHRYLTSGEFAGTLRIPSFGGVMGAVAFGNQALVHALARSGAEAFVLHDDSARSVGPIGGPGESFVMLAAAEHVGVWSVAYKRYVLRRHDWPSGQIADSMILRRDWFPGPEDNEGIFFDLHADGQGLLWTVAGAADPNAPGPWPPVASQEQVMEESLEERAARSIRYRDIVIEALTPRGDLMASVRFDSYLDAARPISGNLWYRPSEDELSIIVLEATLTPRRAPSS